jgi:hypothetical protein
MPNRNRNKLNQPPTGIGKRQPRTLRPKAEKRSEVAQAARGRPELNLGQAEDEPQTGEGARRRSKAGR